MSSSTRMCIYTHTQHPECSIQFRELMSLVTDQATAEDRGWSLVTGPSGRKLSPPEQPPSGCSPFTIGTLSYLRAQADPRPDGDRGPVPGEALGS